MSAESVVAAKIVHAEILRNNPSSKLTLFQVWQAINASLESTRKKEIKGVIEECLKNQHTQKPT